MKKEAALMAAALLNLAPRCPATSPDQAPPNGQDEQKENYLPDPSRPKGIKPPWRRDPIQDITKPPKPREPLPS